MTRTVLLSVTLVAGSLCAYPAAPRAQSTSQAAAADAAPFVGDWTLALNGANGPANFTLNVKVDNDKLAGEIAGPEMPATPITDVAVSDKTLKLRFSFNYQGMAIDTVLVLTPQADGKTAAQMDFAGGAYVATGSATRKEKA